MRVTETSAHAQQARTPAGDESSDRGPTGPRTRQRCGAMSLRRRKPAGQGARPTVERQRNRPARSGQLISDPTTRPKPKARRQAGTDNRTSDHTRQPSDQGDRTDKARCGQRTYGPTGTARNRRAEGKTTQPTSERALLPACSSDRATMELTSPDPASDAAIRQDGRSRRPKAEPTRPTAERAPTPSALERAAIGPTIRRHGRSRRAKARRPADGRTGDHARPPSDRVVMGLAARPKR